MEIRFIQGLANQIIASPGTMSVTASDKRRQQENRVELVEHLPYKQRGIGSSPIGSISISYLFYGEIAQLARACGSYPQCRGFESPSRYDWNASEKSGAFCFTGS